MSIKYTYHAVGVVSSLEQNRAAFAPLVTQPRSFGDSAITHLQPILAHAVYQCVLQLPWNDPSVCVAFSGAGRLHMALHLLCVWREFRHQIFEALALFLVSRSRCLTLTPPPSHASCLLQAATTPYSSSSHAFLQSVSAHLTQALFYAWQSPPRLSLWVFVGPNQSFGLASISTQLEQLLAWLMVLTTIQ
jgi:hypothetical protein